MDIERREVGDVFVGCSADPIGEWMKLLDVLRIGNDLLAKFEALKQRIGQLVPVNWSWKVSGYRLRVKGDAWVEKA